MVLYVAESDQIDRYPWGPWPYCDPAPTARCT
jgi:hypothetical protein